MGQLGTVKIQTPNGPVELPVYELSDVDNAMFRVQTGSGPGAVRLVDPSDADLPQLRMQTGSGVLAPATSLMTGGGGGGPNDPSAAGGDGTGVGSPSFGDNTTTAKYAVADLGWDNSGGTTITESDFDGALADGVKILFEPGTYQIDPNGGTGVVLSGYSNIALIGDGATRDDVRFKLPDGQASRIWNFAGACDNVWWANFVVDQSSSGSYAEMDYTADGDLYAYNIATRGAAADELSAGAPGDPNGDSSCITFAIGSSGSAWIENYETTSPPERVVDYPNNGAGLYAGYGNKGDIDLVNARIENKGEHAFYGSRTPANVRVEGGLFRNNINTNMRLCGEGSYLRNATIVLDDDLQNIEADTGDEKAARGVRWEDGSDAGSEGQTGGYIRNVDFIKTTDVGAASHLIEVDGNAGAMSIEQCRFRDESRDYSDVIYIQDIGGGPQGQVPPQPWPVTVTFCSFTGGGDSAAVLTRRPDTTISDCCLGMSGGPGFDARGDGSINESDTSTDDCDRATI